MNVNGIPLKTIDKAFGEARMVCLKERTQPHPDAAFHSAAVRWCDAIEHGIMIADPKEFNALFTAFLKEAERVKAARGGRLYKQRAASTRRGVSKKRRTHKRKRSYQGPHINPAYNTAPFKW